MKAVKGTRDILPPASHIWNQVESRVREVFRTFNYQEIRTPIFEETALFARGVGAWSRSGRNPRRVCHIAVTRRAIAR